VTSILIKKVYVELNFWCHVLRKCSIPSDSAGQELHVFLQKLLTSSHIELNKGQWGKQSVQPTETKKIENCKCKK